MPEVIVKYKDQKTLKMLKDIAKYFNFSVIDPDHNKEVKRQDIKGVTVIPGNKAIETSDLESVFTNKSWDAKQLRREAWKRKI